MRKRRFYILKKINISSLVEDNEINELEELLIESSVEELQKISNLSWQQLQQESIKFLQAYEKLLTNEEFQEKTYLKSIINNPENINYIKRLRGKKEAYINKAKYLLAFNFDYKLNIFLKELPKKALYVYEENGKVSTYEMSLIELAKYTNAEGKLNISKNQLQKDGRKSLEEKNEIPQEHIEKVQNAYIGTINRLQRYYDKAGLSGSKAQGGLLMWKINRNWNVARVANKGDIKEAYATALLTKHKSNIDYLEKINSGDPEFYNHQLIANFFNKYIYNVTNKPAIVEEDIVGEKFQYGVKSAKAEMPSLQQYLTVAEWIKNKKSFFTKEELKTFIKENFNQNIHRNKVLQITERLTEEIIENTFLKNNEIEIINNLIF